ncbi:hypothetical protein [uncultured Selenomonas sp.]|uniref:hypothetical protein n=1 Tax=uncultured Selenomonas sp. TaxID=159275 RepID=UPI0028DCA606|nr:hypothetical protein [uncultured Selenomonas sp.]
MKQSVEERKRAYDAVCKNVLADRYILANILKECVEEFQAETIDYIAAQCIQGTPEISTTPLRADEEELLKLDGLNTESSSLTEGIVYYDIRFRAVLPRSEKKIKLIINVEAQDNFTPGYSLLKRAMYYCCRMISSQYGTVFSHADYNSIEKVYSIWICTHPSKAWEYTITKYAMQETNLQGKVQAAKEEYDLIVPVMVCLGKQHYKKLQGLLRLLNIVLLHTSGEHRDEVEKELREQFHVKAMPNIGKGVAEMCNLSEGIYRDGVEDGTEQGKEESAKDMVLSLLNENMPLDFIMRVTKLPAERVREIAAPHGYAI